jgi:hypothetical protein
VESLKVLGHQMNIYVERPITLTCAFCTSANGFQYFACLVKEKIKFKISACIFESTNYKKCFASSIKFLFWISSLSLKSRKKLLERVTVRILKIIN